MGVHISFLVSLENVTKEFWAQRDHSCLVAKPLDTALLVPKCTQWMLRNTAHVDSVEKGTELILGGADEASSCSSEQQSVFFLSVCF